MSEPLKMGIVGLGKMGGIRAKTIREHDDAVLVCGTDPNPPAGGYEDIEIVPDYQSVINADVDAVVVCTPNRFIPEVVEAALDAGKHVFCEKPPGRNMADIERIMAREIQQALKDAGVRLLVEADPAGTGPAHIVMQDPDGNQIMLDQHVARPGG